MSFTPGHRFRYDTFAEAEELVQDNHMCFRSARRRRRSSATARSTS